MKKILFLGLIFTAIISVSASAQKADNKDFRHNHQGAYSRFERRHLHHDAHRYHMARRQAHRDGFVSRHERRRLERMRMHDRREAYRFGHNNRHRLI